MLVKFITLFNRALKTSVKLTGIIFALLFILFAVITKGWALGIVLALWFALSYWIVKKLWKFMIKITRKVEA